MRVWIPLLAAFVGVLAIAERYHARFVPEVERQKEQLKVLAYWGWTIFAFVIQVVGIILAARQKGPITAAVVVRIALVVAIAIIWLYSVVAYHLLSKVMSNIGRLIDVSFRQRATTKQLTEAILILSEAPGFDANTKRRLLTSVGVKVSESKSDASNTTETTDHR